MRCTPFGMCGAMSFSTWPFTEPTSETIAPGFSEADLGRDRPARADRNADDDEVGALHGLGVRLDHLIGDAELNDAPPCRVGPRGRDDRPRGAVFARRARDRAADQADADQGELVDDRGGHFFPMNSASVFTTSRFASSVPMVMRSAFGR